MTNLRVGVLCPTLNVYGGGEFVAVTIVNALASKNYEVCLLVNEKIDQADVEKYFGNKVSSIARVIVKSPSSQPKGLIDFYETILRSYVLKRKCDVWIDAYSNCVLPWSNVCYIHFPFLNHYSYWGCFPYLRSRNVSKVATVPYVMFEKNLVSYGKKLVLANSKFTADEIWSFSRKNVSVLYPPVPSNFFDCDRNALVKNPRKDLVVTISRFDPIKRLDKVLSIASLTDSRTKFVLIGRVHNRNILLWLQRTAHKLGLANRVSFFTDISKTQVKEILKSAKIYLHTMVYEHFGISIVEAMAAGCIPVVHNSGGAKEFIPEEFRYNDIRGAAEMIRKNINEWSLSKVAQVVEIAERFREENFSRQFIELFEDYLE